MFANQNMSLMVCQGSILLTILKNPWFSQFPSQVMATLFLPAFWIALRTQFVYSNINFDSSSRTGNILHKNAGPLYDVTIIKINVALASGCGLFTAFAKTIPPSLHINFIE